MTPFVSSQGLDSQYGGPAAASSQVLACAAGNDARQLAWQREMERAQAESWFPGFVAAASSPTRGPTYVSTLVQMPAVAPVGSGRAADAGAAEAVRLSAEGSTPLKEPASASTPHDPDAGAAETRHLMNDRPTARGRAKASATGSEMSSVPNRFIRSQPPAAVASLGRSAQGLPTVPQTQLTMATEAAREAAVTVIAVATPPSPAPEVTLAATWVLGAPVNSGAAPASAIRSAGPGRLIDALRTSMTPAEPIQLHVQWSGNSASVWIGLAGSSAGQLPELVESLARGLSRQGLRLRSVVCNGATCYRQASLDEDGGGVSSIDIELIDSSWKD